MFGVYACVFPDAPSAQEAWSSVYTKMMFGRELSAVATWLAIPSDTERKSSRKRRLIEMGLPFRKLLHERLDVGSRLLFRI